MRRGQIGSAMEQPTVTGEWDVFIYFYHAKFLTLSINSERAGPSKMSEVESLSYLLWRSPCRDIKHAMSSKLFLVPQINQPHWIKL